MMLTDRTVERPVARIPGGIPTPLILSMPPPPLMLPTFNVTKDNPRSSHNRNSECFLLSEKRGLFPLNPQKILIPCAFGGHVTRRVCWGLIYATNVVKN